MVLIATAVWIDHFPHAVVATDEDALRFFEDHRLLGRGLDCADVHLLAAATQSGSPLWIVDRRSNETWHRLRIAYRAFT